MIIHLTLQNPEGRAAEEAAMGTEHPGDSHEFFRYVSGAGPDYATAQKAAQARIPDGYATIAIRTFDDGLAPEIPTELDATQPPSK